MKTTRILFTVALVLLLSMQAEAKKVKLQYQLKAGDQFKYEMTASQDIAQEVMGQSQNTILATVITYEFKVIEVTGAGDYNLSAAIVEYSMSTSTPMGEMKYNSATDSIVPDFAMGAAMTLNEVYTFTLSPMGKISNMVAPEGIVDRVNKALGDLGGQMQMGGISAGAAASAEGFQKNIEAMIKSFPDGGAETKKPWQVETSINQMMAMKVVEKFELVKTTKEYNEIKVLAQISQDPNAPPMEMQGMNITYELVGAKEGTIQLNSVSGLIMSSESITSISGTIAIDSPQLPSPMTIPMTISSKEKITRK